VGILVRKLAGWLPSSIAAVCLWAAAAAAQPEHRPALPSGADMADWNAYYNRGVMVLRSDPAAADALFRWASRLDPSRPEPLYGRWVAFHLRDKHRFLHYLRGDDARVLRDSAVLAAEALQLRALALNPFLHQGLLAAAYAQLPGGWPRDPYTQAFLKYVRGDLEGAAADLAELVRTSRDKVPARHSLALTLANLRRYDEAREQLDSVLAALRRRDERGTPAEYQSKAMLLYRIGLLYLERDRYAEAREAFAQAVVEDASQWFAHRGLGLALRAEGRAAEAVDEYRAAVELAPGEPLLLREYAEALAAAGDHAGAVGELERLVAIAPEWAAARRVLDEERTRLDR
jgi:tetratricopeptide (TPR) repeat protein